MFGCCYYTAVVRFHPCYSTLVCVFVFFPFILDIKFVGRTSRGHMYRSGKVVWPFYCCDPGWSVLSMYRKIYSHANSIRVMMMMMMTQEEGHTGFLIHLLSAVRALIFLARKIQQFLSLVDCEVEFCVLTI